MADIGTVHVSFDLPTQNATITVTLLLYLNYTVIILVENDIIIWFIVDITNTIHCV